MKRLTISAVANGWVVTDPDRDPGIYDAMKTHVFETVEGLRSALPALLGKERTTSPQPSPAEGRPPSAEREIPCPKCGLAKYVEERDGFRQCTACQWNFVPDFPVPSCPGCGSNQFVRKCPEPGCADWVCERPDCRPNHFPSPNV